MGRTAKGLWQGVVPEWAPVSMLALGTGAGYAVEQLIAQNARGTIYYRMLKNKIGFGVGALGAYLAYKLRQKTPSYTEDQAKDLLAELGTHPVLYIRIEDYTLTQALTSEGVLTSPYPLLAASIRLEDAAGKIYLMLSRCRLALAYGNPNNTTLREQITEAVNALTGYERVVGNNLTYIKVNKSREYLAQKEEARRDRSIAAQELLAAAEHSKKNLAWITAVVKFIGSALKFPFDVVYYVVNPSEILGK